MSHVSALAEICKFLFLVKYAFCVDFAARCEYYAMISLQPLHENCPKLPGSICKLESRRSAWASSRSQSCLFAPLERTLTVHCIERTNRKNSA